MFGKKDIDLFREFYKKMGYPRYEYHTDRVNVDVYFKGNLGLRHVFDLNGELVDGEGFVDTVKEDSILQEHQRKQEETLKHNGGGDDD